MNPKDEQLVFEKALGLSPSERQVFLDEICRGDDTLRSELEALLEASSRTDGILDSGTEFDLPSSLKHSRNRVRLSPGTNLGDRFRIVSLIGYGGMGEVYKAYDQKLQESVALKFVDSDYRLDSLLNEVKRARRVSHSNVGRVHDLVEFKGHHFLSMEFIEGEDLRQCQSRLGKFSQQSALSLFRQICLGLQAIHRENIVHRDLKPSNLMVDGCGTLRITDFGLAHDSGKIESTDAATGTPAYMAPEQVIEHQISPRSDLYAAGLILYEMLTGIQLLPTRWEEVKTFHENSSVIDRINPDLIDPSIYRILVFCLAYDPNKRPGCAEDLLKSLPYEPSPLSQAKRDGHVPVPTLINAIPRGNGCQIRTAIGLVLLAVTALVGRHLFLLDNHVLNLRPVEDAPYGLRAKSQQILSGLGFEKVGPYFREDILIDTPALDRVSKKFPEHLAEWLRIGSPPIVYYLVQFSETPIPTRDGPVPDSVLVEISPEGFLRRLEAPLELMSKEFDSMAGVPIMDKVFLVSGLDKSAFHESTDRTRESEEVNRQRVWVSNDSQAIPISITLQTTGQRFSVAINLNGEPTESPPDPYASAQEIAYFIVCLSLVLAIRNCWRGSADLSGAARFAVLLGSLGLIHGLTSEAKSSIARGVFSIEVVVRAGALQVFCSCAYYLAAEPLVRRWWPELLISWTKLLYGRWRDPSVGWHLLVGTVLGTVMMFFVALFQVWDSVFLERTVPTGMMLQGFIADLGSPAGLIRTMTENSLSAIFWASMWVFLLAAVFALTKRKWVACIFFVASYPWLLFLMYGEEWLSPSTALIFIIPFALYYLISSLGLLAFGSFAFATTTVLAIPPVFMAWNWSFLAAGFHAFTLAGMLLVSALIATRQQWATKL